jgi:hypothetical protein
MERYTDNKTHDFYTFDFEEEAIVFSNENPEYTNVYYSYGWKSWVASKTMKPMNLFA